MDRNLIENIIKSNSDQCNELQNSFENPILDKNVARTLSKSFINLLNITKQNTNKNIRHSILENIRNMCKVHGEGHVKVENFTETLTEVFQKHTNEKVKNLGIEQELDLMLVRQIKGVHLNSKFESAFIPEIIQSLLNLNKEGVYLETLSKDILHWDNNNTAFLKISKDLWNNSTRISSENVSCLNILDDVSLKLKAEIEKTLLSVCLDIMVSKTANVVDIFTSNNELMTLVNNCSKSPTCFQLSCSILNYLLIMSNFPSKILEFIQTFILNVKDICLLVSFSTLYPAQLSHLVILMDIDIEEMCEDLKSQYTTFTLKYLEVLCRENENEFSMLLSHYPQWFDVYFEYVITESIN